MHKQKIFITGIAGFIGFHLAKRLASLGATVSGCDNFNDYYDVSLKEKRAQALGSIPIIRCDINDLKELPKGAIVIHLAAQAGVRYSLKAPEKYVHSNLTGFAHILELCRQSHVQKLIFASSSSVYGLSKKIPFLESDMCDQPVSLYGATKKSNELMAHSYYHLYKIPTIGLRFFTVYGPYGRPDMAYFSFTKAILDGTPIKVFNHGKMERDFTYIDDIVDGILGAISANCQFEIFNLGNNHPEPLMDMINYLEEGLGKQAEKIFMPMQPGDVVSTYADISKSHKWLNFSPKVGLKEGLNHFLNWYQSETSLLQK